MSSPDRTPTPTVISPYHSSRKHPVTSAPAQAVPKRDRGRPKKAAKTHSYEARSPSSEDSATSGEEEDEGVQTVAQAKTPGPAQWQLSRQIDWIRKGQELPPRFSMWPRLKFESVATPVTVDISCMTIPLTAAELLTFFSRHITNHQLQDRLSRNGSLGTHQAMFINMQRNLPVPNILTQAQICSYIKSSRRDLGPDRETGPCTTYTVTHYAHQPNIGQNPKDPGKKYEQGKLSYPLIDCGFGVDVSRFPIGLDRGPFTKALWNAILRGHNEVLVEALDGYLEHEGIGRELEVGYSDEEWVERSRRSVDEYMKGLKEARAMGLRWGPKI